MRGRDTFAIAADIRRAASRRQLVAKNTGKTCWTRAEKGADQVQALGVVLAWVRQALVDFDLTLSALETDIANAVIAGVGQACRLQVVALTSVAGIGKTAVWWGYK